MNQQSHNYLELIVVLCTVSVLSGCMNFGPRAVQAGRADYNTVLRDGADEQLLVNLVRLRYRDRPYFLEVSAVTTQFSFSPQVSASGAIGAQDAELGAGVGYSEVPTISYTPLQGDDFARRLLSPVSLEALVSLCHSGWSAERLLRLCVQRINGILYFLSHGVAVPPGHRDSGLVTATLEPNGAPFDWSEVTGGLLRIESREKAPDPAAVRVRYRDHWFYIPDNDLQSKSTFSLLAQLFALQAGSGEGLQPVLTIPVGG